MYRHTIREYKNNGVNIINRRDILDNFWGKTYLVSVTAQNIQFLVNASYESAALNNVMDYIVDQKWEGLYTTFADDDYIDYESEDYITAGNFGYKFTTYHIHIQEV